jgi:hypothetical protein
MLGKRNWLPLLLAATLATLGMGLSAGASTSAENEFFSLLNAERAANGLAPMRMEGKLQSHARNHTQDMIDADKIFHSSSAELGAAGGTGWAKMGENVGRGGTPSSLHKAFMDSSGHRANILGDYNYVGIGTGSSDGRLYVTVVFMKKGSTSSPTTTAPSTTKTTVQKTTTTTTAPTTTTTTTLVVGPDKEVTPGNTCVEATRFWQLCQD